jgi:hypothetical protein
MAHGDAPVSPYECSFGDYLGRVLSITVPWDDSVGGTRNIQSPVSIHRDAGCLWSTIVFANPNDALARKPLPAAPEGDTTLTANQVRSATGARTIDDLLGLGQITAVA